MTRVGGGLGVNVKTDGERITDALVSGRLFRGYENIIVGRDPRDTIALSSRACGWCGSVHMTTSAMALEMAWNRQPPPMAVVLRNIAEATEAIWIHAAHLAVRAGPDYCASVVAATTPHIWKQAQEARSPGAELHGYDTIADIMEALTPVTGRYWTETIPAGRRVQQMISLIYGKYPHPSVISPGTVGSTLAIGNFTEYFTRLYLSVDYVKRICAMWDDLIDFLDEADEGFAELGTRPASFIHAGAWGDVWADESYAALEPTGATRLAIPGALVDGRLETNSLSDVHLGITEDVSRAFYEAQGEARTDPGGRPLPDDHPWSQTLVPRAQAPDATGRYSWCAAPRWHGQVLETTPLGRLWLTALRDDFPPNDFIEPTGDGVRILIPRHHLPQTVVEWRIPNRVNALERLRAEVYGIAFAGLCAAISLLKGFEMSRRGEVRTSAHGEIVAPKGDTEGVGLWDSGRGMNAHWVRTEKGMTTLYQIVSPSTWNASPRDAAGNPGPLEEALIGSPILEEPGPAGLRGIDAMRVIHSFDPCMSCGVH